MHLDLDVASTKQCLTTSGRLLGVELSQEVIQRLVNYIKLLTNWNKLINLTGTRDERDLAIHHVADSLALLRHLPGQPSRILDVGTGAGLPGLVVACVREDLQVTALEPVAKKHAFLSTARRELCLTNFEPRCVRLDSHLRADDFAPYDVAVSRAAFSVADWLEHGQLAVIVGGRVLAMEGRRQSDLPKGASRHPYELDNRTRAVISMRVPEPT